MESLPALARIPMIFRFWGARGDAPGAAGRVSVQGMPGFHAPHVYEIATLPSLRSN